MAVFNMKVDPNVPISRSLGFDPRGVIVDNITAYWLYFPQADAYCPPFTQGWSSPLILNTAGYGYMEIKTPLGQRVQTDVTAGISQFVNVTWTDNDTAFAAGQPSDVGQGIDPSNVSTGSVSQVFATEITYLGAFSYLPCKTTLPDNSALYNATVPSGKRIRILTVTVEYTFDDSTIEAYDSPVTWFVAPNPLPGSGFYPRIFGTLTRENPMNIIEYANGLDWVFESRMELKGRAIWANSRIDSIITYQLIG